MRETVDKELRKISDLYQDRCQDYAQMVSDECEGEVSKASAGKVPNDFSCRRGRFCKTARLFRKYLSTPRFSPSTVSTEDFLAGCNMFSYICFNLETIIPGGFLCFYTFIPSMVLRPRVCHIFFRSQERLGAAEEDHRPARAR